MIIFAGENYMINKMKENILNEKQIRLGLINYVNSLPIVLPIMRDQVKVNAQVILAEPSELNALYAANQLDCGAMSAFAFLEQNNLELIPGISISSQGAVGSVLFFSKKPIEKQPPLKISVPKASATSVNALLLLLAEQTKEKPVLITVDKPDLANTDVDAVLVIGDRALLVDESWSEKYYRYDLGQWWYDTFALPMVFAVFARRVPGNVRLDELGQGLINATKFGLSEFFTAVLDEAQARTRLNRNRLEHYFQSELNFGWSAKHKQALEKYESLCRHSGLLAAKDKKILA